MRRAHEGGVNLTGQAGIVGEFTRAAHQRFVFNAGAFAGVGHRGHAGFRK
jgi:hypothetical protein